MPQTYERQCVWHNGSLPVGALFKEVRGRSCSLTSGQATQMRLIRLRGYASVFMSSNGTGAPALRRGAGTCLPLDPVLQITLVGVRNQRVGN